MPVPGRVDASLQFLRLADFIRNPVPLFDGCSPEPRDLTGMESEVEDAALSVLCSYFEGRLDFGDHARNHTSDSGAGQELDELNQRVAKLEQIKSVT